MSRLGVLFVIPTNILDLKEIKRGMPDAIEPPAKARFMLAYLMRRNVGVDLIDSNVTGHAPEAVAEEIRAADPHLVVVPVYGYNPSASTQTMVSARAFAQAIRRTSPHTPILFTGTHPAALPEQTLREEPIDYVCGGEGPITVHELLLAIRSGSRREDIRRVRSLWYREDGVIGHGLEAPLIDLSQEPALPGWQYMDPRRYRPHHWHRFYRTTDAGGNNLPEPYANPYSVEGCPFHCDFCNIQAPYREGEAYLGGIGLLKPRVNSFRHLRPELFVEEVTHLVETYGVTFFKIPDEMFGLGDHPAAIARLIRDRFGDSLNFWCYFRVDTCKPKDLELLRSAGFRWLALGIEAADSKVRSGQDKRFSTEHVYGIVDRLHAAGIEGVLNYIFGLPTDTMASLEATYQLACELNGAYGNFYCTQALPGSVLHRQAKASGYPLPERIGGPGWIGHAQYSYESEPYYVGDILTPAQILAFRDWANVAYYERPEYRARLLRDPKFGELAIRDIGAWMRSIRTLKRGLFGGHAFWELPEAERVKLVPASERTQP